LYIITLFFHRQGGINSSLHKRIGGLNSLDDSN